MSPNFLRALLGSAASLASSAHAQSLTTAAAADANAVIITAHASSSTPTGQTATSISAEQFATMPASNIGDILVLKPGVTFQMGNGPRDVSVSVRGSNARQTFGIRNVQVFEDGFPVTQPDGLARTDLTDPHAYARIDVIKGPSSALFGNYSTGGAIQFYTRRGKDLAGAEVGLDGGSYGYRNLFLATGAGDDARDFGVFFSKVSGDGATAHTDYKTLTTNAVARYGLGANDHLTFKLIDNNLDANLTIRLSLNQFKLNPFQNNCGSLAAPGCASVSVFTNGANGAKQSLSPQTAGLHRDDRRSIAGMRWEHDFGPSTQWRTQLVLDNRAISQPTSATSAVGTFVSLNLMSDVSRNGAFFGRPATYSAGGFTNYEDINSFSYNVKPGGNATLGALTQTVLGHQANTGAHARTEVELSPRWTGVVGVGWEHTQLEGIQRAFAYPVSGSPTVTLISTTRDFYSFAPEASLTFAANDQLKLRSHVGAGYGTPQVTNLFVTSAGVPGNNSALAKQRNVGVDVGVDYAPTSSLHASLTGFYEFFDNELVSQSAGANLLSFTFNAPKSEHRGVEASIDWRPVPNSLPGAKLSLAYLFNDQIYKSYTERLSAGAFSNAFVRDDNKIPGIIPNYLNARVAYDQSTGALAGLGGYIELNVRDATLLDNANLLAAPGYTLVNLNLHYDPASGPLAKARFYVAVQNSTDETYVTSASNISDSISSSTGLQNGASSLSAATGSIYAGPPRSFAAGLRIRF